MNELELKKLWKTTNERFNASDFLNKINSEEITKLKVQTLLNSMKPLKIFVLIAGLTWVILGSIVLINTYLYTFSEANKFFLFSATIQIVLTAIAIFIYIYQLVEIYQIEIYAPIIKTQEKLAQLRLTTLWSARIMFLQLPVWTTFWWNKTMFDNWNWFQWTITISITIAFTFVALWLFFNIRYKNRNSYWFKLIFNDKEWTPLLKSIDLLDQLKDYK
jgi:hypothetical protein